MQKPIHIYLITCEADRQKTGDSSWVDALQQFLELALTQLSGQKVGFTQKTSFLPKDSYGKNSVLLPIISTNLLASGISLESISASGNPVFKIVKNPVEQRQLPANLASLLAYNFFYFNPQTGLIEEYEQFSRLDSSNAFWGTLVDLAYDILESISPEEARMVNIGKGECIYLAETDTHLQPQRRLVRRELRRYGYRVLPEQELSTDLASMEREVKEALKKSIFSLHLMSEYRGLPLNGQEQTLEEAQLQWSYQHSQQPNSNFQRLVWLPPNMQVEDERQSRLISGLREQADATKGMEIVQVKLEDFKSILLKQLAWQVQHLANLRKARANTPESNPKEAVFQLYCIVDERDQQAATPLVQWWESQGVEVHWIGNDPMANHRQSHIRYLNQCDGCIVVLEQASKSWLVTKLQDILKSPGLGRKVLQKPPSSVAVLPKGNAQEVESVLNKYQQYQFIEVWSLANGLPEQQMQTFLESIENTNQAIDAS